MNLKLVIDGKPKTYSALFIKGRMLRRALEINSKLDLNNLDEVGLDNLIKFVCEVFNNEFSVDDFYDGIDIGEMIPTIQEVIEGVVGKASGGGENPKVK